MTAIARNLCTNSSDAQSRFPEDGTPSSFLISEAIKERDVALRFLVNSTLEQIFES